VPTVRPVKAARRFDTIDLLRGVSIAAVVVLHIAIRFGFAGVQLEPVLGRPLYRVLALNGGNGVTVFFVISGFLITFTSIQRFGGLQNLRPGEFYRIRFARIAPLLLLLLAVLSALHLAGVPGFVIDSSRQGLGGALLSALTFTLNRYEAVHGYLPACWTVLWTLSIEEMFYLFFPLTCVVVLRRSVWAWVLLLLCFVVAGSLMQGLSGHAEGAGDNSYLAGMGPIAMGCLTGLMTAWLARRFPTDPANRRAMPGPPMFLAALQLLGAFVLVAVMVLPAWRWLQPLTRHHLVLPLGVCCLTMASVLRSGGARRGWAGVASEGVTAPVRWFGRHSYEIYLTHEFVVIAGVHLYRAMHGAGGVVVWSVGIFLLTAPLGWAVARSYSEPLNRMLRRVSRG
jgi:peptidoglycan/LPS O-acetylase OafA/YrhL